MRLAFIDLIFTWPPEGGAPADLYYTMQGLQNLGHEAHLFFASYPENPLLPKVALQGLPFQTMELPFTHEEFTPALAPVRFREAIDAWKPDVVFLCFGFYMKPHISQALSHYPQVGRYYAYEPFCLRDYRLFKDSKTCPKNFLETPNYCRRCTIGNMWRQMRTGLPDSFVFEFLSSKAYTADYYRLLLHTLSQYKAIIVYNHFTKGLLGGLNDHVYVIGGGVHLEDFEFAPLNNNALDRKAIILMTGRANDHSKGTEVLEKAGEILSRERNDFEIWLTHRDKSLERPWFKPIGWHKFNEMKKLYKQSDICVVPSTWEEPFGLVAVEAMATGRPVVVGDVGGLREIVVQGETGFIYRRDKPEELAGRLRTLLDDPGLRRRMGDAGRKRVEARYEWKQVIDSAYPALLEDVSS